jgi:hypothetical protein
MWVRPGETKSKPAATKSKPGATKSKPDTTKSKLGATKSKLEIAIFQWLNLIPRSSGAPPAQQCEPPALCSARTAILLPTTARTVARTSDYRKRLSFFCR